jgi:hypothetical protein
MKSTKEVSVFDSTQRLVIQQIAAYATRSPKGSVKVMALKYRRTK